MIVTDTCKISLFPVSREFLMWQIDKWGVIFRFIVHLSVTLQNYVKAKQATAKFKGIIIFQLCKQCLMLSKGHTH